MLAGYSDSEDDVPAKTENTTGPAIPIDLTTINGTSGVPANTRPDDPNVPEKVPAPKIVDYAAFNSALPPLKKTVPPLPPPTPVGVQQERPKPPKKRLRFRDDEEERPKNTAQKKNPKEESEPKKIRKLAHVEGQYATFVYLDLRVVETADWLTSVQQQAVVKLQEACCRRSPDVSSKRAAKDSHTKKGSDQKGSKGFVVCATSKAGEQHFGGALPVPFAGAFLSKGGMKGQHFGGALPVPFAGAPLSKGGMKGQHFGGALPVPFAGAPLSKGGMMFTHLPPLKGGMMQLPPPPVLRSSSFPHLPHPPPVLWSSGPFPPQHQSSGGGGPSSSAPRPETTKSTPTPVHVVPNPHVSLGPLVMLRYHFIETFLRDVEKVCSAQAPFQISFAPVLDVFSNEDGDRWFSALPVQEGGAQTMFQQLSQSVAKALGGYYAIGRGGRSETAKRSAGDSSGVRWSAPVLPEGGVGAPEQENDASSEEKEDCSSGSQGEEADFTPRPHASLAWSLYKPACCDRSGPDTAGSSKGRENFGRCCWPEALGRLTPGKAQRSPIMGLFVDSISVSIGQRIHRFALQG